MIVLKILVAPFVVALTLLVAIVSFLYCVASALCHIGCVVLTLLALVLFIGGLFWEYWADRAECGYCPLREKCLGERAWHGARRLLDSYLKPSVQRGRARQQGSEYRQALKARQVWCEGAFAIQKRCHNLTRVLRPGLEAAEDHCLLSATALNLKRMIRCME